MDKIRIQEAILVEGKYDKNTLSQIVDAEIWETSGFRVFQDRKLMAMLRAIAMQRGLIVFTDSDGAGFVIRNRIKSAIPAKCLKHAYIPDIYGCEKRKKTPGKEGKLGVEGMSREVILNSLRQAGATMDDCTASDKEDNLTKQDYYDLGLSGGPNSDALRTAVKKQLQLPEHLSSKALFQTLDVLVSRSELYEIVRMLEVDNG